MSGIGGGGSEKASTSRVRFEHYNGTHKWFQKAVAQLWSLTVALGVGFVGNPAASFVASGEERDMTCGELALICEPLLSEESELRCSKSQYNAAIEEMNQEGEIIYIGADPPSGVYRDPRKYREFIHEKIEAFESGTKEKGGVDSPEWIARRTQHLKEKRYPELCNLARLSANVVGLMARDAFKGDAEKYFDRYMTGGDCPQGDGFAMWRLMYATDVPTNAENAFDAFSDLFSVQMGSLTLITFFNHFVKLVRRFQRLAEAVTGLEIGEKVFVLLFVDRLSEQYTQLTSTLVGLGNELYEFTLDQLHERLTVWGRSKNIPNDLQAIDESKSSVGGGGLAAAASTSSDGSVTISKKALQRKLANERKKARKALSNKIAKSVVSNSSTSALFSGKGNGNSGGGKKQRQRKTGKGFREKCPNCDKSHSQPAWECPVGHCTVVKADGTVCGSTKHRARWFKGEKVCGVDGYSGPKSRPKASANAANTSQADGGDGSNSASVDQISLALLNLNVSDTLIESADGCCLLSSGPYTDSALSVSSPGSSPDPIELPTRKWFCNVCHIWVRMSYPRCPICGMRWGRPLFEAGAPGSVQSDFKQDHKVDDQARTCVVSDSQLLEDMTSDLSSGRSLLGGDIGPNPGQDDHYLYSLDSHCDNSPHTVWSVLQAECFKHSGFVRSAIGLVWSFLLVLLSVLHQTGLLHSIEALVLVYFNIASIIATSAFGFFMILVEPPLALTRHLIGAIRWQQLFGDRLRPDGAERIARLVLHGFIVPFMVLVGLGLAPMAGAAVPFAHELMPSQSSAHNSYTDYALDSTRCYESHGSIEATGRLPFEWREDFELEHMSAASAFGATVDNLDLRVAKALGASTSGEPIAYLDSGAVHNYLTPQFRPYVFNAYEPVGVKVNTAGTQSLDCTQVGRVGNLSQVLIVEGATQNLISVSALLRDGMFVKIDFSLDACFGYSSDGSKTKIATHKDGLFVCSNEFFGLSADAALKAKEAFDKRVKHSQHNNNTALLSKQQAKLPPYGMGAVGRCILALGAVAGPAMNEVQCCHYRLMGASESTLRRIASKDLLLNSPTTKDLDTYPWCKHCVLSKMVKLPFPKHSEARAESFGDLIHCDIFGPMRPEAVGGFRYAMVLVDDCTRGPFVLLLKHKSEARVALQRWQDRTITRFSKILGKPVSIKRFRTDNAGELTSRAMNDFLFSHRTDPETTVPGCSPQNGVAERFIYRLTLMARHNLYSYRLPWKLWGKAFQHASTVCWMLPTDANEGCVSPWQKLTGQKPDINSVRAFGSTAYSYIELPELQKIHDSTVSPKLLPAVEVGIYVGQAPRSKGMEIWFPKRQKFLVRRHVVLDERACCDANGRISAHITGEQSGKLKVACRDKNDPHISTRHMRFVDSVFERVSKDSVTGELRAETGRVCAPFYDSVSESIWYTVLFGDGHYEDMRQDQLAVFIPRLSNVPMRSVKPTAPAQEGEADEMPGLELHEDSASSEDFGAAGDVRPAQPADEDDGSAFHPESPDLSSNHDIPDAGSVAMDSDGELLEGGGAGEQSDVGF